MSADLILSTILSPIVLFFVLGLGAALLRSQMSVPEAFAKGLAIYLMMAIGLKGGVEMSKTALTPEILLIALAALLLSFLGPFLAYSLLRMTSKMSRIDAAATAGHYGSISIVTFVAATQALELAGVVTSGYMVAMAALMEVPAIMSALWLASRGLQKSGEVAGSEKGELFREVFLNASVVVLVGALAIGWITGERGMEKISPFFVIPFQGVLCLFLLDMGLNAGRGLRQGWRQLDLGALSFGVIMPLMSAVITTVICWGMGLSVGDAALLITLAASASYIAVPAAMRLALPKAQPSIYLTLSLGVTFPFNLTLGIPLYIMLAQWVGG
ncbi:sodium-dependent bicarbonate transport family permease [Hellea balneolensis]|uniref:sodium-dependent bicarbonate transport family permease n=1 Tax=Hellea balneolensis TaxID=287478 RepID=UPI000403A387|nr:sodium-dependent bicarbonate transport family permease [Hellea balneolensis]